jgi:hypothetical protein
VETPWPERARPLHPTPAMGKSHRPHTHHHAKHDAEREEGSDDIADAEHLSDAEFAAYTKTLANEHCHIVGADRIDGTAEVEIVINRGSDDGVKPGDHGVLEGVGKTFTVADIRKRNCTAFVKATDEQIDAHPGVVLNPS